jgi:hypothetical protein
VGEKVRRMQCIFQLSPSLQSVREQYAQRIHWTPESMTTAKFSRNG